MSSPGPRPVPSAVPPPAPPGSAPERPARVVIVGVGGGGGNALTRMQAGGLSGVRFVAMNTDAPALRASAVLRRVQLGPTVTRGLGAGARPDVGRRAFAESREVARSYVRGADLVFVTFGAGGGTGSGAGPEIARLAREEGALVVGVTTRPFAFEGHRRADAAEAAIRDLAGAADSHVVLANDALLPALGTRVPLHAAFAASDGVLFHAARGLVDLVTTRGEVNVDFADVRTVLAGGGRCVIGVGEGTGAGAAAQAAEAALASPLLEASDLAGARAALVHVESGAGLTLGDVVGVNARLGAALGGGDGEPPDDVEYIFGQSVRPDLAGRVRVTVFATGVAVPDARSGAPRVPGAAGPSLKRVLPFERAAGAEAHAPARRAG